MACSSGGDKSGATTSASAGATSSSAASSGAGGGSATSSGSGGATASSGNGGAAASSGSGGAASTSGSGGGSCNLAALNDSFDGASLDGAWTVFNSGSVTTSVKGGSLSLQLTKVALWYQASQGVLVHKSVTGDFKVTTTAHVRKTANPSLPPDLPVQLGGLMARNPNGVDMGGKENYVFVVVGRDANQVAVETKSTTDNSSNYIGKAWPSGDADLRLCRVGATFTLYQRKPGDSAWLQSNSYTRPDLPAKLQVGVNVYDASGPDVTATFDQVSYACVSAQADCDKD